MCSLNLSAALSIKESQSGDGASARVRNSDVPAKRYVANLPRDRSSRGWSLSQGRIRERRIETVLVSFTAGFVD